MKEFYIIPNASYIEYREKGLVLKAIYIYIYIHV